MASTITFEQLLSGAKDFAHLALNAHAEGHTDVFLLEAGVAVERLAKAALVRVHPTLLSEVKGSDDMLASHAHTLAEGAGAAALPAVLADPDGFAGQRIAVVCTGGNASAAEIAVLGSGAEPELAPDQAGS
ncbi:hypothetical protein [Streptomyces inhibens]|uniref:hypothetical protein n=1 Tax=Streptomyces inhibens TaxID=2293571 RepID=UPI001EE7252F|nr:hypothetical protein [Streptomyces inhibens]UKY54847.1 hypothetical protein KI385_42810 [Streptomyces inhibens]